MTVCSLLLFWLICLTNNNGLTPNAEAVDTKNITLSTDVTESITLTITSGASLALGSFTPGTSSPTCNASGSTMTVTTNASNGYTLGIHDNIASTNSPLTFGGIYIPDATGGTMTTPATWTTNGAGFLGLGVTDWQADTTKDTTKWGAGTTSCDASNKWAAVPQTTSAGHTVTGFRAGADGTKWGFKVDAPPTQTTGAYSGDVTFTATAVIT